MSAFQRRLDLLDFIPRFPKKIATSRLLHLLELNGYQQMNMRTVQRDLCEIEKLGFFGLVVDKRSKPFGWSIDANWQKLNITFMDANTALAFSTLEKLSDTLLPESTQQKLSAYFNKANTLLENENNSLITHWKNSVAMVSNALPVLMPETDKKVLDAIKEALFTKKQISAQLKRYLIVNKAPVWKTYNHINPLGLVFQDGLPILVCSFGAMHKKLYRFPLAYIKKVELEVTAANIPPNFDFDKAKKSIENINEKGEPIALKMKIKRDAPFVLKGVKLSDDQYIEKIANDDENYLLCASVKESPQLKAFLRGLGSAIEVLEPVQLRNFFVDLAKDMATKYL